MRKSVITALVACLAMCPAQPAAARDQNAVLADGMSVNGIDGIMVRMKKTDQKADRWSFRMDRPLTDGMVSVPAGQDIELLPSASMEEMVEALGRHGSGHFRLWGSVTAYRRKNYLFATYFLPVESAPDNADRIPVDDSGDSLLLPEDIAAKLTRRPVVTAGQLEGLAPLQHDSILADQDGFLVAQPDGEIRFLPDGVGRNIQSQWLLVLPSQALQKALEVKAIRLSMPRFRVSGILTRYGDRHYLLLQRAVRVYGYGNFNSPI